MLSARTSTGWANDPDLCAPGTMSLACGPGSRPEGWLTFSDPCSDQAGGPVQAEAGGKGEMHLHKIWIEQCAAARGIEEEFGTQKALAYLVAEKFLNYLEAAEKDAE